MEKHLYDARCRGPVGLVGCSWIVAGEISQDEGTVADPSPQLLCPIPAEPQPLMSQIWLLCEFRL